MALASASALQPMEILSIAFFIAFGFTLSDAWHAWDEQRPYLAAVAVATVFLVSALFFFILAMMIRV